MTEQGYVAPDATEAAEVDRTDAELTDVDAEPDAVVATEVEPFDVGTVDRGE